MKNSTFKRTVAAAIAWTIGFSPAVVPYAAVASEPEFVNARELTQDFAGLLDRAMYPKIPRAGTTGMPTSSELARLQIRLTELRTRLQSGYLERLLAMDETLEKPEDLQTEDDPVRLLFLELEYFFQSASRYESLKMQLGQPVDATAWNAYYELRFDVDLLSQPRFLTLVSSFADGAAVLPVGGWDREKVASLINKGTSFLTHLERGQDGKYVITFRLNPKFVEDAERLVFISRPELKGGLQYAAHYALHTLYDSLTLTRALLRQDPESMPEPPAAARQRYASFRIARNESLRTFQRTIYAQTKPEIFGAIVDAAQAAEASPATRTFTQDFWREYTSLLGLKPPEFSAEELKNLNAQDFDGFERAASAFVNLLDVERKPELAEFILIQAKRISLRKQFLSNMAVSGDYNPKQYKDVADFIDRKAFEYARGVLGCTMVDQKIQKIQRAGYRKLLDDTRVEFQQRLETASLKLSNFSKEEINLKYLLGAQAEEIKALKVGPLVNQMLEAVKNASGSYESGYYTYAGKLYEYVNLFKIDKNASVAINDLDKIARDVEFNPAAVKDVKPEYMEMINPTITKGYIEWTVDQLWPKPRGILRAITPETIHPRNKDLMDMIAIGKLLKFNVYEKFDGQKATVDTLNFDKTVLGRVLQSERAAYLDQMERDVINSNPLLGGLVLADNPGDQQTQSTPLYKLLAKSTLPKEEKFRLVEEQLKQVELQIHRGEKELEGEIAKIDALPEHASPDDLGSLGSDLLLVATKASGIRLSLETFAAFESFYTEMRREIEMPGFVRKQWEQFTSFADSVSIYMMYYLLAQVTLSRIRLVGKLDGMIGKVLTPIFGPNFSRLQPFIWTLLGINVVDQGVRGFGTEMFKTEALRKYFECGSGSACVALYSDVADQTEKMMEPRRQMFTSIGMIVGIIASFRLIRAALSLAARPFQATMDQIAKDISVLGLRKGDYLDRETLRSATANALSKARANPEPLAAKMGEVLIRQSYHRIESRLLKQAMRFVKLEEQYRPDLIKLNLYGKNWKTPEAIQSAFTDVENRYKAGKMLRSEYDALRSSLASLQQALNPAWDLMHKDVIYYSFYESAMNLSTRAGTAQLRGALSARSYDKEFFRAVDRYMDGGTWWRVQIRGGRIKWVKRDYDYDRLEVMLNNVANEVRTAPQLSNPRFEQLSRYLKGEKP